MRTDCFNPRPRSTPSTLLWAGAGAIALAGASFAFLPMAQGSVQTAGAPPATAPVATELNRIDHSEIDWDKYPATPGDFGMSVAAYGLGA